MEAACEGSPAKTQQTVSCGGGPLRHSRPAPLPKGPGPLPGSSAVLRAASTHRAQGPRAAWPPLPAQPTEEHGLRGPENSHRYPGPPGHSEHVCEARGKVLRPGNRPTLACVRVTHPPHTCGHRELHLAKAPPFRWEVKGPLIVGASGECPQVCGSSESPLNRASVISQRQLNRKRLRSLRFCF